MIVYFSGTGNSKYLAQMLEDKLSDTILDSFSYIRSSTSANIESEKPLIFVSPTYSWQIPHVFRDFIKRSSFKGNKKAYFIMDCGSDIANAGAYNEMLSEEMGLDYMGTLEVIMPENYIAMFSAPNKEEALQIIEGAEKTIMKAIPFLEKGEKLPERKLRAFDKMKSGLVNKLFYPMFVKAEPYRATDKCISCGNCVRVCPMANISLKDGKPVWGSSCTQCMACMNYCPTEAIEYGNKSKGKVRYKCPFYEK